MTNVDNGHNKDEFEVATLTLMVVLCVSSCIEDCLKIKQIRKANMYMFKIKLNQAFIIWPNEVLGQLFVPGISVVAWNQLELRKKSSISSWN